MVNANVVHRWRQLVRAGDQGAAAKPREFVAVAIAPQPAVQGQACRDIEVALRRGAATMKGNLAGIGRRRLDMRAGTESALARVVTMFGAARPHHAYLFANGRANRMKVLVHDGIGAWLAARRLNSGKFVWPEAVKGTLMLSRAQLDGLVLGLPWQRIGEAGVITLLSLVHCATANGAGRPRSAR